MIKYFAIAFLSFFAVLSSCTEAQEDSSTEQLLEEINKAKLPSLEEDDQAKYWKNLLNQKQYTSDKVARASINYQIGRCFAPLNTDSAEVYITKALILIEDIEGFENEKTLIYNGLGTIAFNRSKFFLSSFYKNKVVSILDANPSISTIPAKNKIMFYLYSAENNAHIGLKESAYDLTRKAANYIDSLPESDYLRFRIYTQLFSTDYDTKKNTDSLRYYLEKRENQLLSVEGNRFYYLHKASFFELSNQFDSARVYYQRVLEIDQNELKDKPYTPTNTYITYCRLLQNSIERKKMNEANSTISKLREMQQDTSLHLSHSVHLAFGEAMMNYHYQFRNFDKYHEATEKVLELTDEKQKKAELQAKEEMHTMYQLEENKKSIKELNQSVEITESELQKTKYFLAITILAILVILAILAILYYRQKSRKLQQEYEKVILEQKLLRTQMEPHFIFNTLSTLQSLIRFQDPKKAIDYLNQFSRLLRSNLELSRKEMISLEDEVETMHNYLSLQQARFKDYFTYQIQVPDELEIDALFIPPMLIQPFVENSILHGFDGEREWRIEIKITELVATKQLQIEIIDNGVGIHTAPKKKHKSLSGDIAKERLEILSKKYKIPTDYQIISEQGKGTTVCLKLPIINGFQQN
ncbi:sensor histidine kinase [Bernardetia sp. OM2101]|uniref:sensor histidine kinase n=1 Tax=Bernardetia sp. OM2101 TaxID=3344876 RepID=UPI0035D138C8